MILISTFIGAFKLAPIYSWSTWKHKQCPASPSLTAICLITGFWPLAAQGHTIPQKPSSSSFLHSWLACSSMKYTVRLLLLLLLSPSLKDPAPKIMAHLGSCGCSTSQEFWAGSNGLHTCKPGADHLGSAKCAVLEHDTRRKSLHGETSCPKALSRPTQMLRCLTSAQLQHGSSS